MRKRRCLVLATAVALAFLAPPAFTQPPILEPFNPVDGRNEAGGEQSWRFSALSGAVLSFNVEAVSPGFDPTVSIRTSDGFELVGNDDYNYPESLDAMLEAVTIPRTGQYDVVVGSLGDTSGDYRLTMLPGYAEVGWDEPFDERGSWKTSSSALTLDISDGLMALSLAGVAQYEVGMSDDSPTLQDFYAEANIAQIGGRNGWVAGLALRGQTDRYYLLALNSEGMWRFLLRTPDGLQVVREWTPHPAILPGEDHFRLGVLANGPIFEVYYNGQYAGQASDSTLAESGRIGVLAATVDAVGSETVVSVDHVAVTRPRLIDGQVIVPERLALSSGNAMGLELQRQHLVPPGGALVMDLPESSVRDNRPGVTRFILGKGTTYRNFAFGARVTLQAALSGPAGCGLVVRSVDDTHFTLAYIDQTGAYGLAQRDGESFQPGIFGQSPSWEGDSHYLLVIADSDTTHYYLDGRYRGALKIPPVEGEIGNAVVNFEPIDTTCQFNDSWLWLWD